MGEPEPGPEASPPLPAWIGHGYSFVFHNCTKFLRSVYLKGWCSHASGAKPALGDLRVHCADLVACSWDRLPDVDASSCISGFEAQILLSRDAFPEDIELVFDFGGDEPVRLDWPAVEAAYPKGHADLRAMFSDLLAEQGATQLLDIGGRARSGVLYAEMFPGVHTEVLDILPGEGVTVVCDAHRMSEVLEPGRFDAVISISVFEHLVMPWKVAVEMNRVMKTGGVALIHSHQSIGMHDMPWDFFRYSDSAWKSLFNAYTGFEIITSTMRDLNFILPFVWKERYRDAEKAAGFESSTVLVRKIGEPRVDWPLNAEQVTADQYPEGEIPKDAGLSPEVAAISEASQVPPDGIDPLSSSEGTPEPGPVETVPSAERPPEPVPVPGAST